MAKNLNRLTDVPERPMRDWASATPHGLLLMVVGVVVICPQSVMPLTSRFPACGFILMIRRPRQQVAGIMQIIFVLTILALVPSILILTTSFTRLVVYFPFSGTPSGSKHHLQPGHYRPGFVPHLFHHAAVWQRIIAKHWRPISVMRLAATNF